jgi:hypothetical protein
MQLGQEGRRGGYLVGVHVILCRIPKAGGPPEVLVANARIAPYDLQIDERHVWWGSMGDSASMADKSCVRRLTKP